MKLPYIEITQPIGTFYIVKLSANTLFNLVKFRRHNLDSLEGIQRNLSKKRVLEIANFCKDSDAVFPTSIIISVDRHIPYNLDRENHILYFPDNIKIGEVIDGQHRLWGIQESKTDNNFELPVILMFDLELAEKAYVFSIINSTQTKVNRSLISNLFGLSLGRSPYKTCHQIARSLNSNEDSPFYNRMKMLGKKESNQPYATLSQGTFVNELIKLISKYPEEDTRKIKLKENIIDNPQIPLRTFFIENHDEVILKIISNCFSALKEVFYIEWSHPENNVLWKTTGFSGVMIALNTILRQGIHEKDLTLSFFSNIFKNFKSYIESKSISLTSRNFPGGGKQNQKHIAQLIISSMNNYDGLLSTSLTSKTEFEKIIIQYKDSIDPLEKLELSNILVSKQDNPQFFNILKNTTDLLVIEYPYLDIRFTIPKSEMENYNSILILNWFNNLDAETWHHNYIEVNKDYYTA